MSVHTRSLVAAILERSQYPDQAYRSCIGLINLSKKYSTERLDMACRIAATNGSFSYQAVKKILVKGQDLLALDAEAKQNPLPFHENLRGQAAYR